MTAGADGQSGSHGVIYMENLDQDWGNDTSQNTGYDDCNHRDWNQSIMAGGDAHCDWCGHGFWKQGPGHGIVQLEQAAHEVDAPHGSDGTAGTANQNRQPVLFEDLNLSVDGHCQTCGGRCQEHVDDTSTGLVGFIWNFKNQ